MVYTEITGVPKMKLNYIIIPLITVAVSVSGRWFAQAGLRNWYKKLKLPDTVPDGRVIGAVWTVIFILSAISALIVWNSNRILHEDSLFVYIFGFFILNAVMNIFWNFLFFALHMLALAVIQSAALGLSVLVLMLFIFPISSLAAALLVPYFVWVCFATYLNYSIWQLNK